MAVQTFDVKPLRGMVAEGKFQTELNRRGSHWFKSDAIPYNGDTSNILFRLPPNTLVVSAFVSVETAFDASGTSAAATGTLIINDTGTKTIFDSNLVAIQVAGLHPSTDSYLVGDAGGNVEFQLDPGTTTKGSLRVYVEVVQLETLL